MDQASPRTPATVRDGAALRIEIVAKDALHHEPEGRTRGYAHAAFDEIPAGAPGRLDFDPLVLFASGELRPGEGFEMHPHANMEIVDVVLSGRLRHRDSLGHVRVMGAGEASLISAGSGYEHAAHVEGAEPVHVLVIWLRPALQDTAPAFHRRAPSAADGTGSGGWTVLAAPFGHVPGALPVGRDAILLERRLAPRQFARHRLDPRRRAYAMVLEGAVEVGDRRAVAGDRILVQGHGTLVLTASEPSRVFLLDMA